MLHLAHGSQSDPVTTESCGLAHHIACHHQKDSIAPLHIIVSIQPQDIFHSFVVQTQKGCQVRKWPNRARISPPSIPAPSIARPAPRSARTRYHPSTNGLKAASASAALPPRSQAGAWERGGRRCGRDARAPRSTRHGRFYGLRANPLIWGPL
jgi:hypothetical protein